MSKQALLIPLLAAGLLAGCGKGPGDAAINLGDTSIADGAIKLRHGEVALHAQGAPEAVIDAAGTLRIGGQAIATTPAQRAQIQRYYRNALAVREHGIATGKAGAAVAGQAVASTLKGLASGNTDQIDKDVDASAEKVQQAALKICDDLDGIKAAQDDLAGQLAAFKPYAGLIGAGDVKECRQDDDDKDD
ncbi:hypothetical protein [Frateuria defendens]|uniref:hypothetical protein n=1 Tax=Frateuria defendens TaxID=2219559 RepID=UPI00066FE816|nr:hypothetical protein [Frateuria defendens]